jgi:hypothetical protein
VVRDELAAAHRERLEPDLAHSFEEPLAPAEHDRRDVQPQLVDQAGGQVLVDVVSWRLAPALTSAPLERASEPAAGSLRD